MNISIKTGQVANKVNNAIAKSLKMLGVCRPKPFSPLAKVCLTRMNINIAARTAERHNNALFHNICWPWVRSVMNLLLSRNMPESMLYQINRGAIARTGLSLFLRGFEADRAFRPRELFNSQ